MSGKYI
jgi:hypothetical protein